MTPRQRSQIRKATRRRELDPSEVAGELNIVPFLDIVVNLIMFLLLTTAAVLAVVQAEVALPSHGPGPRQPALDLAVTVTPRGVIVTSANGKLAEGCESTTIGDAITIPAAGGHYDWRALSGCLARVKARFPDERQVIVSADPQIEYEHFVAAMDASRRDGDRELFPEVLMSAGVR